MWVLCGIKRLTPVGVTPSGYRSSALPRASGQSTHPSALPEGEGPIGTLAPGEGLTGLSRLRRGGCPPGGRNECTN